MKDVLYRYVDVRYSQISDAERDLYSSYLRVELRTYEVKRRTPKGAWIQDDYGHNRFVLLTARKRYACETFEDALASFIERKRRQLKIYEARVRSAREALQQGIMMATPAPLSSATGVLA